MIVHFDRSFSKSLDKLKNKQVKEKLKDLIVQIEKANDINDLPALKRLKGYPGLYRMRIGNYRIGIELINPDEILLILIAHRKDIYKRFP